MVGRMRAGGVSRYPWLQSKATGGITRALVWCAAALVVTTSTPASADPLQCEMSGYKAAGDLRATVEQSLLVVSWAGQAGTELRTRYAIDRGGPVLRELAIRKSGGDWTLLGQNLTPEYQVTSGVRRMSQQQAEP